MSGPTYPEKVLAGYIIWNKALKFAMSTGSRYNGTTSKLYKKASVAKGIITKNLNPDEFGRIRWDGMQNDLDVRAVYV